MRNVKPIVTAALTLTVICAVVVAALAGTNALTHDTIDNQEREATTKACALVIDADDFEEETFGDDKVVYYEAKKGDQLVGYVFKTSTTGKSSGLVVMTGVDVNGVVTGVSVVSNNETAGYVDKVTKDGLLDRFKGKTAADADTVKAVSQATKSSNGIKAGVSLALRYFAEVTSK